MFAAAAASDASESSVGGAGSFRVSVNLQRYFSDVRSCAYMVVSRGRRVRWLQRRIRRVFALSGEYCLCLNGHLLPPCEPLGLLNPDDQVEVIPLPQPSTRGYERCDAAPPTPTPGLDSGLDLEPEPEPGHAGDCGGGDIVDVPDAPDTVQGEKGSRAPELTPDGALLRLKRRALALLDQRFVPAPAPAPPTPDAEVERRKRRRVRRRPRRDGDQPSGLAPGFPDEPHDVEAEGPGEGERAAAVVPEAARRPRLVRSLDCS